MSTALYMCLITTCGGIFFTGVIEHSRRMFSPQASTSSQLVDIGWYGLSVLGLALCIARTLNLTAISY